MDCSAALLEGASNFHKHKAINGCRLFTMETITGCWSRKNSANRNTYWFTIVCPGVHGKATTYWVACPVSLNLQIRKWHTSWKHISGKAMATIAVYSLAIAFATSLANGEDPTTRLYDPNKLSSHLIACFSSGKLSKFPSTTSRSTRSQENETIGVEERILL